MDRAVDSELRCETSSRDIHEGINPRSPRAGENKSKVGEGRRWGFGGDRR